MTGLGWFFLSLMALATVISVSIAWHASPPVDLRGILARWLPAFREHTGHHVAETPAERDARHAGESRTSLTSDETVAFADATFAATEPFLPPPPDPYSWMAAQREDGPVFRTLASYMQAGRPVEIPETPDRPPWMITTNALDAVPATDEGTLAMYHGRHSRREPVYGEAPVLAVEAEAGAQLAERLLT